MEEALQTIAMLQIIAICYVAVRVYESEIRNRERTRRSIWIRRILREREIEGTCNILIPKLMSDSAHYKNFFRMTKETFSILLNHVQPLLERTNTKLRKCVTVNDKLSVTLRYLATGNSIWYDYYYFFN